MKIRLIYKYETNAYMILNFLIQRALLARHLFTTCSCCLN